MELSLDKYFWKKNKIINICVAQIDTCVLPFLLHYISTVAVANVDVRVVILEYDVQKLLHEFNEFSICRKRLLSNQQLLLLLPTVGELDRIIF